MAEYIDREAFVEQKRKQYCEDCNRRKGFKRGQYKILYEIGEAPCRACEIDDMLNDVEDFPAADVRPERYAQKVKFFNDPWTGRMFTTCTACDGKVGQHDKFCKHCGAKFEVGE